MKEKIFCTSRFFISIVVLSLLIAFTQTFSAFGYSGKLPEKVYMTAQRSFVNVEVYFKKLPIWGDEAKNNFDYETIETDSEFGLLNEYIEENIPFEAAGVVIGKDGIVVFPETRLPIKNIREIIIKNSDGTTAKGMMIGVYLNAPLTAVKILDYDKSKFPPVEFSAPPPFTTETNFTGAIIENVFGTWKISGDILDSGWSLFKDKGDLVYYTHLPYYFQGINRLDLMLTLTPGILFDDNHNPIGVFSTADIDANEKSGLWKGSSLLNSEIFTYEKMNSLKRERMDFLNQQIYEIKFELRKLNSDDTDSIDSLYNDIVDMNDSGNSNLRKEITFFGTPIDEKRVLIPSQISSANVKLIDKISLIKHDLNNPDKDESVDCEFFGASKESSVFIIKIKDEQVKLNTSLKFDNPYLIEKGRTFFSADADKIYGKKAILVEWNKYLQTFKGYMNTIYPIPLHQLNEGSFLLNDKWEVCGVWARDRAKGGAILSAVKFKDQNTDRYAASGTLAWNRFLYGEELKRIIKGIETEPDKTLFIAKKDEENNRAWFGIEFEDLSEEIAKTLNVMNITRGGSIGLLTTVVYDNSPASKLGITKDDILLSLKTSYFDFDLELAYQSYSSDYNFSPNDSQMELRAGGSRYSLPPRWRRQDNYLNNLLDKIGIGENVDLIYYSKGEIKRTSFIIEKSPGDYMSAKKFKTDELGITVKDITYEVRKALDLKTYSPGVIISKIEEGSPSAIARLNVFEILSQFDGKPIGNIDDFKKFFNEAKNKKSSTITLKVINLDKSRFADLQIKW